jgi:ATP-dependent DNA helicase RecQ
MDLDVKKILLRYWGFPSFRPLQEDIIQSVLEGKDTLALLPTGGGKSLCFQVPALATDGICLVVTPLIALMKDQVENLKKKGIHAAAVFSGMHPNEIDITLDNAIYGNLKFLYLSPERLETVTFRERLRKMKVNLLAVDEAHCISQWGYDFRPPYLNIAEIRQYIPEVPVLALTATATSGVVTDIQDKLKFRSENIFQKSFERKNLAYVVIKDENKLVSMLKVLKSVTGPAIVYVRNRKKTREVAEFLQKNNISADYYHAGLDSKSRSEKQDAWINDKKRVIASTNAFGMGIDKPNVRVVVHLDLTNSLEAYFQEAGRAGRDEKKSYAVLIFDDADITNSRDNFKISFPELNIIKSVYQSLGNYYQLATGSGKDLSFDFDLKTFAETYKHPPLIAYNAIKFLEKEGYIMLNDAFHSPSKIHINYNHNDLYRFQVENPSFDSFIKILLRSYTGLFNDFVKINENEIAKRSSTDYNNVITYLNRLDNLGVISYLPRKEKPQLVFAKERQDPKNIHISPQNYKERKEAALIRLRTVINYARTSDQCRSRLLLAYFGEKDSERCGICDVCQKRNKLEINDLEFKKIEKRITILIKDQPQSIQEIVFQLKNIPEDKIIKVIRWLEDNKRITRNEKNQFFTKKQFRLFF